MARKILRPTRNPKAVATIIDLIHGYASGVPATTKIEKAIERALTRVDSNRQIAQRMVKHFSEISSETKAEVFGTFVEGQLRGAPTVDLKVLFQPNVALFADDVGLGDPPIYPTDTQFTVVYTGLYCNQRTGDRPIIGSSDEPYVITSGVFIEGGENKIQSEIHPVGDPDQHYGDVDSGEFRVGPIAACWSGLAQEVSIVSVVMENDEGDPEAFREEIETAVAAAAAVALFFGYSVPESLQDFAVDGLLWLIGSGDDEIGTDIAVLTAGKLRRLANTPTLKHQDKRTVVKFSGFFSDIPEVEEVIDQTNLDRHFITNHTSSGKYVVTYKVTANKAPIGQGVFGRHHDHIVVSG